MTWSHRAAANAGGDERLLIGICIVAGIKDEARGEVPKAWIKLKTGRIVTDGELRDFLKDKLSPIEMPRQIEVREKPLPKTMIGKLSRKDILAEEAARKR